MVAVSAAGAGDALWLDALDVKASAAFSLFSDPDGGPGFDGGGESGESESPAGDGYDFDEGDWDPLEAGDPPSDGDVESDGF